MAILPKVAFALLCSFRMPNLAEAFRRQQDASSKARPALSGGSDGGGLDPPSAMLWGRRRKQGSPDEPKTVIFVGGTGAGKSTLANFMAGKSQVFVTGDSSQSVTSEIKVVEEPFFGDESKGIVRLVDCPGLMDTGGKGVDKKQWDAVVEALTEQVRKAHSVVLVLNGGQRATEEVRLTIKQLRDSFGSDFWAFLRVVVNRVNWDVDKQRLETESRHQMLLDIEEGLVGQGLVSDSTRAKILGLPVYGVDLIPTIMDGQLRDEEFWTRDLDKLEGLSLGQCIALDARLQAAYRDQGFSSFKSWKKENRMLRREMDRDLYEWGQNFGELNLGRLDELRQDITETIEPLDMKLSQLTGATRQVLVSVETQDGTQLGKTPFELAVETTIPQLREQAVFPIKAVRDLKRMPVPPEAGSSAMGWLAEEVVLFRDDLALITDAQLRSVAADVLSAKADAPQVEIKAKVSWAYGSPPYVLDPELLKVCVEKDDVPAMAALMKDHITSSSQLSFMTDLEKNMPMTKRHGSVFQQVKEVRKSKIQEFRESDENQQVMNKQKSTRDELIQQVEDVRDQLQPYVDEIMEEADARAEEAEEARSAVADKVQQLLNSVKFGDVLQVPPRVPEQATSKELLSFVFQLGAELNNVVKGAKSDIIGADELIWNSRVLKGIYLGVEPQPVAQDMVMVARVPHMRTILSPPEMAISYTDQTQRSQGSNSRAKKIMEKGGASFASSFSGSGAMVGSYGIGAFGFAGKVASATEEISEQNEKGRSEMSSYYMLRNHYHPMQLLELDNGLLRLTPPLVRDIARIIERPQERWPADILDLFKFYGTHYCPSVELGGIWTQEARYEERQFYHESELKTAISKCLDSETKGGAMMLSTWGFGTASGATSASSCSAASTNEAEETQAMMKSTIVTRRCISNLQQCPTSDKGFIGTLRTNGNWAVIDRKMGKCVALWEALRRRHHEEEVVVSLAGRKDNAAQLIDKFADVAAKVWHLKVLDLPQLCAKAEPPADVMADCRSLDSAYAAGADQLFGLDGSKISRLWQRLKAASGEAEETSKECAKLSFCNEHKGQGQCVWKDITGTQNRLMVCECKAHWMGKQCQTKIPNRKCEDIKKNYCTAHPGSWYQPDCDVHGSGYKYLDWKYCAGIFGTYHVCKKQWECEPETEGHNCC